MHHGIFYPNKKETSTYNWLKKICVNLPNSYIALIYTAMQRIKLV